MNAIPISAEPELRPVAWRDGMHCTETAICAATGLPVERVVSAIEKAVADAGAELDPEGAYKCEHWFAALEPLGFNGSVDPLDKGQSRRTKLWQSIGSLTTVPTPTFKTRRGLRRSIVLFGGIPST